MAVTSASRAIWISTFIILVCTYLVLNKPPQDPSNAISITHSGDKAQTPVIDTAPSAEEESYKEADRIKESYKNLSMIEESSSPEPTTEPSPYHELTKLEKTPDDQRPLITYAYSESDFARANLKFFVEHALHEAADFIFILNGRTDVDQTIIFAEPDVPEDLRNVLPKRDMKNVIVKKRPNTCFDLGAQSEVLNSVLGGDGWADKHGPIPEPKETDGARDKMLLRNKYKRYILMNASIRGPFVPRWSTQCWSDSYLNRLTDRIKLVGMSYNCHGGQGHVQSMIWATDHIGLPHILSKAGIGECFQDMALAMLAEVRATQVLRDVGYGVDTFTSAYHSKNKNAKYARMRAKKAEGVKQFKREIGWEGVELEAPAEETPAEETPAEETPAEDTPAEDTPAEETPAEDTKKAEEAKKVEENKLLLVEDNDMVGYYWRGCKEEDWLWSGGYFGMNVHPYETLFMKSHRHIDDTLLDRLTEWHDGWGYESWDVCY